MNNDISIEIETASGVWTDITADVYQRDSITITRGRSDEQSQASPQTLQFTLDNRDGKYSPRNPLSPLFGKVGRNTPVRATVNDSLRFYGEIAALAPKWNENHNDNWIPVVANGIMRRLSQGQAPLSNALRDWILAQSTLAAYYPLNGGEDTIYSQNLAPGMSGSFQGWFGPLFKYGVDMGAPWLGTGMLLNATGDTTFMQGAVNAHSTNVALDFVFQSQAIGVLDVLIFPTGYDYFRLRLNTSDDDATMQVSYWAEGFIDAVASDVIPELQDTELHTCRFELHQVAGPFVDFFVYIDGELAYSLEGLVGASLTRTPYFRFHYSRFVGQTYVNLAHLAFWADNTASNIPDASDYADAAFAHLGETAEERLTRVCNDGDIPIVITGSPSVLMGPQYTETRLEQIRDVESTDLGILAEQRDDTGLLYRSTVSMYNQTAAFTLDYSAGQVAPPLEPIDDDRYTRNDVTATRREGGSARVTIDTGPLSTQDPPDGVGRYATEVTVNVETDDLLDPVAGWVAGIGTLDKARWESVTVNLASPNIGSALADQILAADVGDLFTITDLDDAFVYDDVNLIIVGYSETITKFTHTITFNCMPADPYEVYVVDDNDSLLSGGDLFQLNGSMTTTSTSVSVVSTDDATLWTTTGPDTPVMIAGEEMLLTAVTGTTPGAAQTFTLTRSRNGVVKTHAAGETVRLKRESVLAL